MRLALSLLRRRCSSRSPRPLPRINWWCVTLLVASIGLSVGTVAGFKPGADWAVLEYAAREAGTPALYAERGSGGTATFVWSPVAAHLLQLLTPVGMYVWMAASFAAAFAMPTWRLRLIVLVSWPFWSDVMTGNLLTVIFLSAVWALRGSTVGTLTFFAFSLLIPRPLLLPTVLWILWRRTEWRWRFAAMFAVHTMAVWWTGLGPTWIETVLTTGPGLQELVIKPRPDAVPRLLVDGRRRPSRRLALLARPCRLGGVGDQQLRLGLLSVLHAARCQQRSAAGAGGHSSVTLNQPRPSRSQPDPRAVGAAMSARWPWWTQGVQSAACGSRWVIIGTGLIRPAMKRRSSYCDSLRVSCQVSSSRAGDTPRRPPPPIPARATAARRSVQCDGYADQNRQRGI